MKGHLQLSFVAVRNVEISHQALLRLVLQFSFGGDAVYRHLKPHLLLVEFLMVVRVRVARFEVDQRDAWGIVLSNNIDCAGYQRPSFPVLIVN
jgi:hypothetical protein